MTTTLAQSQEESSPESSREPEIVGTLIADDVTAGTDITLVDLPDTTAPPSPVDTAVANLINSVPALVVFCLLTGLVIYLVRERKELTLLLAGAVGPDMAKSLVDMAVKGALSALGAAARALPGEADDKYVERLGADAGLMRVINADGSYSWQPIPGASVPAPSAATPRPINDEEFKQEARKRGIEIVTHLDGSLEFKSIPAAG